MKKTFALGAIAGISSVAVAIPLLAQISSAASVSSTGSTAATTKTRPVPTQACVQAEAGLDAARLSSMDAFVSAQKTALQAHQAALTAAAAITDDTQRQAAIKAANDAQQTAMKAAMDAQQTANKSAEDAVKTACGNMGHMGGFEMGGGMGGDMMRGGPRGGMMKGGMNDDALAQKLGITADQLKTELQSGKTIQQIAQEHGVTLPTPPANGKGGWFGHRGANAQSTSSQTTTAQ